MLEKTLRFIEKFIPKKIYKMGQPVYHFLLAIIGMIIYRFPAKNMIMIGVTGTKGKTSAVNFLHSVLSEEDENNVGLISTANIKIGKKEIINKYHMSMPGRFILQSILRDMKNAGCKYVVAEVTSEGIKQFRHLGLFLDISIFTNLSPEHLKSHNNSFDKYKEAKAKIFSKNIFNKLKFVLINKDDENARYFIDKSKEVEQILFSLNDVNHINENENGVEFIYKEDQFNLNILGKFNIYNALPAIILGEKFKISKDKIKKGLLKLNLIPGRMEEIREGQDFKVIVDYAHEKLSMTNLLDTAKNLKLKEDNKIITVLGGDGGGRDEQRLFDMGRVVGEKSDIVIVSNSDPYFDDEETLAQKIAGEADKAGKEFNKNLFIILDRGEAIKQAINFAKKGDVVLLTTRGSLNTMSIKGKNISSDDRVITREMLRSLKTKL